MSRQRWVILAVVLLLAIHAGLLAYSATRHSPTMLEPALLAAGLSHWEFGRFELYRVNPPLVRMVAALPVMLVGYESDWGSFYEAPGARPEFAVGADFIKANGERSIWLMTLARWACIPFSLIGGLFAFAYSRELWQSTGAGLATLTVWCFEPNILAHAELITNDVACTSFGIGATWLFWRWLKQPTWGRAALAGLVLGLAQLAKASWLFLFGLWPLLAAVWWLAKRRRAAQDQSPETNASLEISNLKSPSSVLGRHVHHPATQLAGLLVFALYILNLGYAFNGSFTPLENFEFVSSSMTRLDKSGDIGNRFHGSWFGDVPVPFPQHYVLGIDSQKHDFEVWDRPSYLRGEWKQGGWWYYYLYGMLVKTPHGVQLLILVATCGLLWCLTMRRQLRAKAPSQPNEVTAKVFDTRFAALNTLVLLAPGLALFTVASSQTEINEHFRYVLPTIGVLTVFEGMVVILGRLLTTQHLPHLVTHTESLDVYSFLSMPTLKRGASSPSLNSLHTVLGHSLLCLGLAGTVVSTLRTYPHHLAYFNETAGGTYEGWRHMLGSSLDWGQDLLYARNALTVANPAHAATDPNCVALRFHALPYSAARLGVSADETPECDRGRVLCDITTCVRRQCSHLIASCPRIGVSLVIYPRESNQP